VKLPPPLAHGHDPARAGRFADYDKAIELDPKYAMSYYNRGRTYESKAEHDRAIADYDKAIELDPKYAMFSDAKSDP
jgi:tetratricopeptide (TPR) repeat protein